MLATVRTKLTLHQRARLMIVAALLALSMIAGVAGTTTQVDAAKKQPKVVRTYYSADIYMSMPRPSNDRR